MNTSRILISVNIFIVYLSIAISATLAGTATAGVYQCKLKSGNIEIRDFPCDFSSRPASPLPSRLVSGRNSANAPSNVPLPGFANNTQYEIARNVCLKLLSQHDFTAPMMRCGINDSNCFNRANQESSAIFRQLIAIPEWQNQQCDLVLQMEYSVSDLQGCSNAQIIKPVPFLGTAGEVIFLSDGSVWKDLSYKYLYLYSYSPIVQICPLQAKMILEFGGQTYTFTLMRLK